MFDLNLFFKYLNIACGCGVIACEILLLTNKHAVRDIIIFLGVVFIATLFVSVNYIANEWIQRYFGFLYAWEGRALLILYLGWLILGNQQPIYILTGSVCVLTGVGEMFVARCHNRVMSGEEVEGPV